MFKIIDLFAGIGGIRRGFELTGKFTNVLSAEIDKYACETYKHLYNEVPYNDVTSEEFKLKVENTKYDVLLGGFPCQSFSIAGKKEGFKDKTRGTLFFDIADIISRTRPKSFLLENVEGLITHEKGKTFETILQVLIFDLNYNIVGVKKRNDGKLIYSKDSFVRNCKDFGIPQKRARTYIMGFDSNIIPEELLKGGLPKESGKLSLYKNLNDLLEFGNEEKYYLAEGGFETLKKHKKNHGDKGNGFGFKVVNSPEIENPIANTILATGGSGKERNLVYDPQNGIGGKIVSGKKTRLNSEGIRVMTPREWGKLQGFINYAFVDKKNNVDKFTFPPNISNAQLYKQFGNSVSIPVIEKLAEYMLTVLTSKVKGEKIESE